MIQKETELLPGRLDMLILKTLDRSALPMHGYGLAQYIKQISSDVLRVEECSLYPALQRLALKGWVTAEWAQSENNRRPRFYKLTPQRVGSSNKRRRTSSGSWRPSRA